MGSRIIPMSQDVLGEFGKGNTVSQTAERTRLRMMRRLRERHLLRRERLHRVLNQLDFLPIHYKDQLDFEKKPGKIKDGVEPKIAYRKLQNSTGPHPKAEFIFKQAYQEMLEEFQQHNPTLLLKEDGSSRKIPYDWTVYYLRKKALYKKIEKEELAWLLLHFNQKRGYYQARGEEEEEQPNKDVQFYSLVITDVLADEEANSKGDTWYTLQLSNGWVYRRSSKTPLFSWKGTTRDFIVTTDLESDGTPKLDKEGQVKRSFRAPGADDWTLLKKKTEHEIEISGKTVGSYIFDNLLLNPRVKIKGKLVRTIERKFYRDELHRILELQGSYHNEFKDAALLKKCIQELYKNNQAHQELLQTKNLAYLLAEDILFYQRPLRSKKSTVGNCPLEFRPSKDENGKLVLLDGKPAMHPLKVAPKSNPYYQEFRLWNWLHNLRLYRKTDDLDCTGEFIETYFQKESLFCYLNDQKEITQEKLIKFLLTQKGLKGKALNQEVAVYRWNYVEGKIYPGNETRAMIISRLGKCIDNPGEFLDEDKLNHLWHIIYSVTDTESFGKALQTFAKRYKLDEKSFFEAFRKTPPFDSSYGAYSEKAIKKILPLLRVGRYWKYEAIAPVTRARIEKLLTGEFDEKIRDQVRSKAIHLEKETDFQGLPEWLAKYIVYDRHAEAEAAGKWNSVTEIDQWLNDFRQYSLRNMVVEQVTLEAMRVVRDIWIHYGKGAAGYFDEIHIELGRELKQTNDERKDQTSKIAENEATNQRIKYLLAEMQESGQVQNVRPYSSMQQELLKIYEEGVIKSGIEIDPEILKISKTAQPTTADLKRYRLWLEQKYRSPYTGQIIPLSKLFTPEYEIEHIIPRAKYYDDSFSNKVICEAAVNKLKDNRTGYGFVKNNGGQIVELGFNRSVKILNEEEYKEFVQKEYASNPVKRKKLLMEEIPEEMTERQLNDTRYISRLISQILSNLVRSETNDDGVNSKNIIQVNGKVTAALRQDWGLNDVWNEVLVPRFQRMNALLNTDQFLAWNQQHQKWLPTVPLEHAAGFNKKRIDHRHHALDALVIACATRSHVNFINNQNARKGVKSDEEKAGNRYDLRTALCYKKNTQADSNHYEWIFKKPWENFTAETREKLQSIVISYKKNLRVLNSTSNYYSKWGEVNGERARIRVKQTTGAAKAIRKPLHKDTVFGAVSLQKKKLVSLTTALDSISSIADKEFRKFLQQLHAQGMDKKKIQAQLKSMQMVWEGKSIAKVEIWYWDEELVATRKSLDTSFTEESISSITDTGIQKILLNHLNNHKGKTDEKGKAIPAEMLAFSPEGIEQMNQNLRGLNDGKDHQPIEKVRVYEPKGNKFSVGEKNNKRGKYVEAAKGTNLYFGIYQGEGGERSYDSIPLNLVIERLRQGLAPVPETNEKGHRLLFDLSPNDLVYVPTEEEQFNGKAAFNTGNFINPDRVYKVVSFTGNRLFCVRQEISIPILDKVEFSTLNKMEKTVEGTMIKTNCWKISCDRLGNIKFL
ncbi:hypothetical protein L0U88_08505 [Flavihumibacter sp. RY-1]|uniref:CRISPR-associated endonuclease Cas9 n=2 Tax=Flavihumibacter fluminis TaxID=2909236 RepID=A0ABS9BHT6_9BACT|nr:type II CRISPR RNA-guided endonuclease Cas9 [Flavihumibacter fluminis]MCF1714663.1 hypothetical protein [Flavihumibacter fluminis]